MIDYKTLSASLEGSQLYEFLEEVKYKVADVRTPLNVENEIAVRKAVCETIDELIIQRLKTANNPIEKTQDNWQ